MFQCIFWGQPDQDQDHLARGNQDQTRDVLEEKQGGTAERRALWSWILISRGSG